MSVPVFTIIDRGIESETFSLRDLAGIVDGRWLGGPAMTSFAARTRTLPEGTPTTVPSETFIGNVEVA